MSVWTALMASTHELPLDHTAIGLSIGCAAHCLLLPAVAAAAPSLGTLAEAEWVHWAMLALAAPVALVALSRKGAPTLSWALAGLGVLALLLGVLEIPSHDWETPLTVAGGLLLALAHIWNLRVRHLRSHAR
jgi:hypothetical protein